MISLTAHGISNVIDGKLVSGPFDRVASGGVCTDTDEGNRVQGVQIIRFRR